MKNRHIIESYPTIRYAAAVANGYTVNDNDRAADIPVNSPGCPAWNGWRVVFEPVLALKDGLRKVTLEGRTKGDILDELLAQHWTKDVLGGALVALRELQVFEAGEDELPEDLRDRIRALLLARLG